MLGKKYSGTLIVIDGGDGSGKATQVAELVKFLKDQGFNTETMDFPRPQAFFGKFIYESLAGEHGDFIHADPYLVSIAYAADRFVASSEIKQWLDKGAIVILDRYVSANQMHQGGKITDDAEREKFLLWLDELEHGQFDLPRPDLVILLDVPVGVSMKLAKEKALKKGHYNYQNDQAENDPVHLAHSKEAALKIVASNNTWERIQCYNDGVLLPVASIHKMVVDAIKKHNLLPL